MKKAITIGIIILAMMSVGVTVAFFSDTETSQGNRFEAGVLDLSIEDATATIPLSFINMQPYERKVDYIKAKNIGTLSLDLSMSFENTESEGGADLSEIMQGEIFIERDLLYYLYKFKDSSTGSGQGISPEEWLDRFIEKVEYLIDNDQIDEEEGQDLIDKARGLII